MAPPHQHVLLKSNARGCPDTFDLAGERPHIAVDWKSEHGRRFRAVERSNHPSLLAYWPGIGVAARLTLNDYARLAAP